jgi:hypothetical protein
MNLRSTPVIAAFVAVLVLGAGAAVAFTTVKQSDNKAGQGDSASAIGLRDDDGPGERGFRDGPPPLDAAASYLGLSVDALWTRLRNGDSLADVAKAQNKSVDGLEQTLVDDVSKRLGEEVQQGDLTEQQKNEILSRIRSRVDEFVRAQLPSAGGRERFGGDDDGPGFGRDGPDDGPLASAVDAAAKYLDVSAEQLFNRVRSGDTLAEIAKSKNKSVDGLKDAILGAITTELNQAVQAGDLTESQKQEFLDHIRTNLDDFVNGRLRHDRGDRESDDGPRGDAGSPSSAGSIT